MDTLREEQFFNGLGENDPAFSARDRMNRAPKSLGFINLSPTIGLTPAGEVLLDAKRKEEIFLRQLLKFQIPSPFHKPSENAANFRVKPYLEILRLIRRMGTLRIDELQIFGMQLTDWHDFELIASKIELFRCEKAKFIGKYRTFKAEYLRRELEIIFKRQIEDGHIKIRGSIGSSMDKFIRTKANNLRDYADSCFRYLRATGMVNVSHIGKSLSIVPEYTDDIDFILKNTERDPQVFLTEEAYSRYLGRTDLPQLLSDNRGKLISKIEAEFPETTYDHSLNTDSLKDLLFDLMDQRRQRNLSQETRDIKEFKQYDEIQTTFEQIKYNELYDAPLMMEWNVWRAMTMLDGGEIKANLSFDSFGKPSSTAQGNCPDIVCDYGDFLLSVEVTLSTGQKQYEMEGEPVSRHLGKLKKTDGRPCYCLFIAPSINEACIAHFYTLHRSNVSYYGGSSVIVPLPLDIFRKMVEDSRKSIYSPCPRQVQNIFLRSEELAKESENEVQWFAQIKDVAMHWLE